MDNNAMVKRLKEAGITFDPGLSEEEIQKIEAFYGFRFPAEIKSFYKAAYPTRGQFFYWRDCSARRLEEFRNFCEIVKNAFLFDIEHNSLHIMLKDIFPENLDKQQFTDAVLKYLDESPKLIPFYAHRCFFDGMGNMPIVSFWQPTDTIFYGKNFEDYLEVEFLNKPRHIDSATDRMKDTGIWYYLIG